MRRCSKRECPIHRMRRQYSSSVSWPRDSSGVRAAGAIASSAQPCCGDGRESASAFVTVFDFALHNSDQLRESAFVSDAARARERLGRNRLRR